MGVMLGMGEGGRSPFYILQLPINRPMAALLVVVVVVVVVAVVVVVVVVGVFSTPILGG